MRQPKSIWPAASVHPELVKLGMSGFRLDLRGAWGCSGCHRQRCHLTTQEREAELRLERREHQALKEMHHETCVRYGLPVTDAIRCTALAIVIKLAPGQHVSVHHVQYHDIPPSSMHNLSTLPYNLLWTGFTPKPSWHLPSQSVEARFQSLKLSEQHAIW